MAETPQSTVTIVLPGSRRSSSVVVAGDYDSLLDTAKVLNQYGFIAVAENESDTPRLRVTGFRNVPQLARILGEEGISVQQAAEDNNQQKTDDRNTKEWVKDHTLRLSGITYLIGDFSLFLSGIFAKRYKEATAGLLYAGGGAVSAIYGDPSLKRQMKNVGGRLGAFMIQQGAKIEENSALYSLSSASGSLMSRIQGFLYRHPSEVHNAIYAYGGTQLLQSGLQKRTNADPLKRAGWWEDMAAGGLVTTGGLIGSFAPEQPKDDNVRTKGITAWIKERPLRLSGYLYMLNNLLLIKSAWGERKENPKHPSYMFKFLTAGSFLIANTFLSRSSRHNDSSEQDLETKRHIIGGLAAEVIVKQPEEKRATLISQVAGFLSQQHETKEEDMSAWEVLLKEKVLHLSRSQWAAKREEKLVAEQESTQQADKKQNTSSWRDKVSTQETPLPSQSL